MIINPLMGRAKNAIGSHINSNGQETQNPLMHQAGLRIGGPSRLVGLKSSGRAAFRC